MVPAAMPAPSTIPAASGAGAEPNAAHVPPPLTPALNKAFKSCVVVPSVASLHTVAVVLSKPAVTGALIVKSNVPTTSGQLAVAAIV